MGKWRDRIDKVADFITKHTPLRNVDGQMMYTSSRTTWKDGKESWKNVREWHIIWLLTHPILFVKNFIYNNHIAFMAIGLVALICILVMMGVIEPNFETVGGIALLAFIGFCIYAYFSRDDDESQ